MTTLNELRKAAASVRALDSSLGGVREEETEEQVSRQEGQLATTLANLRLAQKGGFVSQDEIGQRGGFSGLAAGLRAAPLQARLNQANIQPDPGFLGRTGQGALKGFGALIREISRPAEFIQGGLLGVKELTTEGDVLAPVTRAFKGLALDPDTLAETERPFEQLTGLDLPGPLGFVANFGTEVLTDPLNLIGGLGGVGRGALKTLSESAEGLAREAGKEAAERVAREQTEQVFRKSLEQAGGVGKDLLRQNPQLANVLRSQIRQSDEVAAAARAAEDSTRASIFKDYDEIVQLTKKEGTGALSTRQTNFLTDTLNPEQFASLSKGAGGIRLSAPRFATKEGRALVAARAADAQTSRRVLAEYTGLLGRDVSKSLVFGRGLGSKVGKLRSVERAQGTLAPYFDTAWMATKRFGDVVGRKFSRAMSKFRASFGAEARDVANEVGNLSKLAYRAAERAGISADDVQNLYLARGIGRAIDKPVDTAVARQLEAMPEMQELLERTENLKSRIFQSADADDAQEVWDVFTETQMSQMLTRDGREFLLGEGVINKAGEFTGSFKSALREQGVNISDIDNHSIPALNRAIRDATGAENVFEENVLRSLAAHASQSFQAQKMKVLADDLFELFDGETGARLVRSEDDYQRVIRSLPNKVKTAQGDDLARALREQNLPEDFLEWKQVKIPAPVGVDDLTVRVPPELREPLLDYQKVFNEFDRVDSVLRKTDRWMRLWKGYATVPFVFGAGFHMRNLQGNLFNNWLAGINDMAVYTRALRIELMQRPDDAISRRVAKRLGIDMDTPLSPEDLRLFDEMNEQGVREAGFIDLDDPDKLIGGIDDLLRRRPDESAKNILKEVFNPQNAVIRQGGNLGRFMENNARMAHFIAKRAEGLSPGLSGDSVRQFLFDYGDLTAFEQRVLKRFVPFYTFARKNAELQLKMAVRNPSKIARIAEIQRSFQGEAEEGGPVPQFIGELGGFPLPKELTKNFEHIPFFNFDPENPVFFAPDLPIQAASEVLIPGVQIAGSVPGLGKLVPDSLKGDKGIQTALGSLTELIGGGAPGALKTAFEVGQGQQDFAGLPITGQPDSLFGIPVSQRVKFLIEQAFPLAARGSGLVRDAGSEAQGRRLVSQFTGLRGFPVGERQQRSEVFRRVESAQELLRLARQRGFDLQESQLAQVVDQAGLVLEARLNEEKSISEIAKEMGLNTKAVSTFLKKFEEAEEGVPQGGTLDVRQLAG